MPIQKNEAFIPGIPRSGYKVKFCLYLFPKRKKTSGMFLKLVILDRIGQIRGPKKPCQERVSCKEVRRLTCRWGRRTSGHVLYRRYSKWGSCDRTGEFLEMGDGLGGKFESDRDVFTYKLQGTRDVGERKVSRLPFQ